MDQIDEYDESKFTLKVLETLEILLKIGNMLSDEYMGYAMFT